METPSWGMACRTRLSRLFSGNNDEMMIMITTETPPWGMVCRTSLFSGNNDDNDNDNDNNGDTSLGYGLQNQVILVIVW